LSHRSAAALWRIALRAHGPIEVTRTRGWRAPPGLTVHRGILPADEVGVIDGIPTTGLARTFLDLASVVPRNRVEKALGEAEVLTLTDKLSIRELIDRYPRRQGTAVLRSLVDSGAATQGVTRSALEDRFAALLDDADLPRPRFNADLQVRGRFLEVDCLWAEQRLIVELDGRAVHGTRRAFEKDRERDRLLLTDGWRVIRVTWRQLNDDAPAVIADLRRLLRKPDQAPTL
jgi:very-short-patch-repair endonuclease